eukprot:1311686-Rhodomonas_salina.1
MLLVYEVGTLHVPQIQDAILCREGTVAEGQAAACLVQRVTAGKYVMQILDRQFRIRVGLVEEDGLRHDVFECDRVFRMGVVNGRQRSDEALAVR